MATTTMNFSNIRPWVFFRILETTFTAIKVASMVAIWLMPYGHHEGYLAVTIIPFEIIIWNFLCNYSCECMFLSTVNHFVI